jgi:LmbE family N-acetylglucosaminyl deacetylase
MIRIIGMIALASLSGAAQAQTASSSAAAGEPQQVLVFVAHPDDELFMAPAIAALARQGAEVTLAYATLGDAGPGISGLEPGELLGKVRIKEAACALDALGGQRLTTFHAADGRLGLDAHRGDSEARKLFDKLRFLVDNYNLVLTWGPDGGYGHADHRMVSALTTQAVQALPGAKRPKLLYVGIPAGHLPLVPQMADWAVTDPALLTESIPYTPADLAAATAAAQCHVTQFDEASRQGMMGLFDATMWQGKVHFRPAF